MTVVAAITAGVGHEGRNVMLLEGEEWPADHPLVKSRPELFRTIEPDKPRRGRAPKVREQS